MPCKCACIGALAKEIIEMTFEEERTYLDKLIIAKEKYSGWMLLKYAHSVVFIKQKTILF